MIPVNTEGIYLLCILGSFVSLHTLPFSCFFRRVFRVPLHPQRFAFAIFFDLLRLHGFQSSILLILFGLSLARYPLQCKNPRLMYTWNWHMLCVISPSLPSVMICQRFSSSALCRISKPDAASNLTPCFFRKIAIPGFRNKVTYCLQVSLQYENP